MMRIVKTFDEKTRCIKCNGFTLVELLVVIGIMAGLVALIGPAASRIGSAGNLNRGGDLVAGFATQARQNSLSKNAMTAVVVVTDPNVESRNRLFTIVELVPAADGRTLESGDWKQISKWETLASGVLVNNWTAESPDVDTVSPALPNLTYGGHLISKFNALIFMPNGSTFSNSPTMFELIEGYFPSGATAPQITNRSANGGSGNYYRVTVMNATGRIKIDRP